MSLMKQSSPGRQNLLYPIGDPLPCEKAIGAGHEHRIMPGVSMTDRGAYGDCKSAPPQPH